MNEIESYAGWPERISACWRQSVGAILETGRLIAEAKAALPHGEFSTMIRTALPFGARTAQMLVAISADPRLTNPNHGSLLPPHWRTLYELTRLDDDTLNARIEDGTIRSDMDRKDISTAVKQTVRATREVLLGGQMLAAPIVKAGVIVEDFEWDHVTWSDKGRDRAAENHYIVSRDAHTAAEIVERTKGRFASAADNCVVWSWATVQHLAIALDVMRLRGFDYKSHYIWAKDSISLGYWGRNKHEILLIGVRGNIPCPAPGTQWESFILAPKGEHSAKPECFLEMIEGYFPTLPKLELNRRGPPRKGWIAWGNEAEVPDHDPETGEIIENADSGAPQSAATESPGGDHVDEAEVASTTPTLRAGGRAAEPVRTFSEEIDTELPAFLRRGGPDCFVKDIAV